MGETTITDVLSAKKFLARYYHRGSWWGIEIYARDWDDADAICLAHNLQLDGEHVMTIPVVAGSWLPTLICRFRNWLRA